MRFLVSISLVLNESAYIRATWFSFVVSCVLVSAVVHCCVLVRLTAPLNVKRFVLLNPSFFYVFGVLLVSCWLFFVVVCSLLSLLSVFLYFMILFRVGEFVCVCSVALLVSFYIITY